MGALPLLVGPPQQEFLLGEGIDLRQALMQRLRQTQAEAEEGSPSICFFTSCSIRAVVLYRKAITRRKTT